jgi:hypothetical protein
LLPADAVSNEGGKSNLELASLRWHEAYLDHNELELALGQLKGLGELNDCSAE